ncbi:MAG: SDR family NAD(P)-dependent oxidoreductase, partial [Lewinella sp.]|nr:SDR family NAD(P)-dependent oxidoreductase [Lewinella sp.]
MKRLSGKTAIITGGARGIGRATAAKFVDQGASVALWDIDEKAGQAAAVDLQSEGSEIRFYKVNTADLASVKAAAEMVVRDLG